MTPPPVSEIQHREQVAELVDKVVIDNAELVPCQGITSMGTVCGRMSKTGWCYQHGPTV
jgi:hypothetical protein